jgi:thiamine kinase-like enzyme
MTAMTATLRHALAEHTGVIHTVTALSGGITNRNEKLETSHGPMVLRLAGARTELLGINRAHEYQSARIAHAAGVGAEPIAFLPEHGAILTRFISGATTLNPASATQHLKRIVAQLRAIHTAPAFPAHFSAFDTVRNYHRLALEHGVYFSDQLPSILAQMHRIEQTLAPHGSTCPCHNDLLPGNFLDDGQRIWIIDWEYAGNGNPFFDLGNFAINLELDETGCQHLLEAYFGHSNPQREAQLHLMRLVSDLREAFWGYLQSGISTLEFDFVGYANQHLERFQTNAARAAFTTWIEVLEP